MDPPPLSSTGASSVSVSLSLFRYLSLVVSLVVVLSVSSSFVVDAPHDVDDGDSSWSFSSFFSSLLSSTITTSSPHRITTRLGSDSLENLSAFERITKKKKKKPESTDLPLFTQRAEQYCLANGNAAARSLLMESPPYPLTDFFKSRNVRSPLHRHTETVLRKRKQRTNDNDNNNNPYFDYEYMADNEHSLMAELDRKFLAAFDQDGEAPETSTRDTTKRPRFNKNKLVDNRRCHWNMLQQVLQEKLAQQQQPKQTTTTAKLVIHLRLGDVVDDALENVTQLLQAQQYYFRTWNNDTTHHLRPDQLRQMMQNNNNNTSENGDSSKNNSLWAPPWMDPSNAYVKPLSYLQELWNPLLFPTSEITTTIDEIVLLAAAHQGHEKGNDNNNHNNLPLASCTYLHAIRMHLEERLQHEYHAPPPRVTLRVGQTPDSDILYLAKQAAANDNADTSSNHNDKKTTTSSPTLYFLPTGGGFSRLLLSGVVELFGGRVLVLDNDKNNNNNNNNNKEQQQARLYRRHIMTLNDVSTNGVDRCRPDWKANQKKMTRRMMAAYCASCQ